MLSLVAYQSSDDSDSEETSNKELKDESSNDSSTVANSNSLLNAVPAKTKETVKITVPSLKEFEDDEKDEPSNKKLKISSGTGLISLLPPPKYSKLAASQKSFMPYVLTKKQVPSSSSTARSVNNANSKELSKKSEFKSGPLVKTEFNLKKESSVVEDDDHTPVLDFFSLQEPAGSFPTSRNSKVESLEESSQVNRNVHQNSNQREASSTSHENNNMALQSELRDDAQVQYTEATSSEPHLENEPLTSGTYEGYPEINPDTTGSTTDEGFLKLQGKKRKGQEEINIIDVSVDDQLSDKTQWLTKSITQELVHRPSRKKNDMPTQLQKRKHQITYLAFQAKERELELKNQWSQNRLTKRETQAKYGF